MRKNFFKVIVAALVLAAVAVSFHAYAQEGVSIRTKNYGEGVARTLVPRAISGYKMVEKEEIIGKDRGEFHGDFSVKRVYFPKTKAEYDKLIKSKEILKSTDTILVIYVDIYNKLSDAKKYVDKKKMISGTLSGQPLGDAAWHLKMAKRTVASVKKEKKETAKMEALKKKAKEASHKKAGDKKTEEKTEEKEPTKEEQKKMDEELAKKLESDPNNYNSKTLVVVKRYGMIHIMAKNYRTMPEDKLLESTVEKILPRL